MRILLSATLLLVAISAHGATIAITSDQPIYDVGDTITLSIAGDAEGATASGAYGVLFWNRDLADTLAVQQGSLGSDWLVAATLYDDGAAYVWNQVAFPDPLTGAGTSTISLLATAPGALTFAWETEPVYGRTQCGFDGGNWQCLPPPVIGYQPTLEFFGATGPGYSVLIAGDPIVPVEPPSEEPTDPPSDPSPDEPSDPPADQPVEPLPDPPTYQPPSEPPSDYPPASAPAVPEPSAALVFAISLIVCVVATRKRARRWRPRRRRLTNTAAG